MDMDYPRILVISSNCFSQKTNNGKTLASFFRGYPKDKIAQCYFWPEYPDSDVCDKYYRLTDIDILNRYIFGGDSCGSIVNIDSVVTNLSRPKAYNSKLKNWSFFRLCREFLWLNNNWKNGGLYDWIMNFNPQIIFFCGSNSPAIFRITKNICDVLSIPIIIYLTDDYYLPRISFSISYHIRRYWLLNSMRSLLKQSNNQMITINEYMRDKYKDLFGRDSIVAMKIDDLPDKYIPEFTEKTPLKIIYIGNLAHNRWKILLKLANVINKSEYRNKFVIEIYSLEMSSKIKSIVEKTECIVYCGGLNGLEVKKKQIEANILLHVESFEYDDRKNTLLSLSTKITEYMASGRAILAVGPKDIASMRFLRDNTQAYCITDINDSIKINQKLFSLLDSENRKLTGEFNWNKLRELQDTSLNIESIKRLYGKLLK